MIDIGDLRKLRRISKQCTDNKKTHEYVKDICYKIRAMLVNYAQDTNTNEKKTLEKYLGYHASPKNFNSGQIPTKYINEAIDNGNIRERMTLIMNFCMSGSPVILWAAENNKHEHITKESIATLHRRLYNFTGLRGITKPYDIHNHMPFKLFSMAFDGAVSASRMAADHNSPILRMPRVKRVRKYFVNIKDVYPKISSRELLFINGGIKNNILPWISGLQYWEVNKKNFYVKLMRHYKHLVVCGPSSNTDLILSIFRLFDNFDIHLAIFACVSHLCNAPHHSPCEILLAALPYGLGSCDESGNSSNSGNSENEWTIEEDAFKYVKRKLKVYR